MLQTFPSRRAASFNRAQHRFSRHCRLPGGPRRTCRGVTAITFRARAGNVILQQSPAAKLVGMNAALAGLLGASIGAIAGIFGGFVAGWQQRKADALRWEQARADELRREERRSLLELTSVLAEGSQAAAWFSWAASVMSAEAVKAEAREYDARMRVIMPRLFSAEAAASGLSEAAFSQMDAFVERLLSLDSDIGKVSVRLDIEPEQALQDLKGFKKPAYDLRRDIVEGVRLQLRVDRPDAIGNRDVP